MKKFKVKENQIGIRLDKFLTDKLPGFSRSQIQKSIRAGNITVNDKKVTKHYLLKDRDEIKINSKQLIIDNKKNINNILNEIEIIIDTNDYLVINKPAGLLVHPIEGGQSETLVDWLLKKCPEVKNVRDLSAVVQLSRRVARVEVAKADKSRPGIVHRLDRDVSGLMVIAKTQKMFDNLKEQFQSRKIEKEYLALVHGNIELDEGEINRSVTRSKKTGLMIARGSNQEQGKNAITKFEVIKRFPTRGGQAKYTLLKVKLITGRTHQIRVHLRSIGHSVVGDTLYQTKDLKKKKFKIKLDRIFLCAVKLGFYDLNNQWQEFNINLPEDLTRFLDGVR